MVKVIKFRNKLGKKKFSKYRSKKKYKKRISKKLGGKSRYNSLKKRKFRKFKKKIGVGKGSITKKLGNKKEFKYGVLGKLKRMEESNLNKTHIQVRRITIMTGSNFLQDTTQFISNAKYIDVGDLCTVDLRESFYGEQEFILSSLINHNNSVIFNGDSPFNQFNTLAYNPPIKTKYIKVDHEGGANDNIGVLSFSQPLLCDMRSLREIYTILCPKPDVANLLLQKIMLGTFVITYNKNDSTGSLMCELSTFDRIYKEAKLMVATNPNLTILTELDALLPFIVKSWFKTAITIGRQNNLVNYCYIVKFENARTAPARKYTQRVMVSDMYPIPIDFGIQLEKVFDTFYENDQSNLCQQYGYTSIAQLDNALVEPDEATFKPWKDSEASTSVNYYQKSFLMFTLCTPEQKDLFLDWIVKMYIASIKSLYSGKMPNILADYLKNFVSGDALAVDYKEFSKLLDLKLMAFKFTKKRKILYKPGAEPTAYIYYIPKGVSLKLTYVYSRNYYEFVNLFRYLQNSTNNDVSEVLTPAGKNLFMAIQPALNYGKLYKQRI